MKFEDTKDYVDPLFYCESCSSNLRLEWQVGDLEGDIYKYAFH